MYFAGRWVPMEVMNAIFVFWGIAVLVLGVVVWRFWRKPPPAKPKDKQSAAHRRKSRRKR